MSQSSNDYSMPKVRSLFDLASDQFLAVVALSWWLPFSLPWAIANLLLERDPGMPTAMLSYPDLVGTETKRKPLRLSTGVSRSWRHCDLCRSIRTNYYLPPRFGVASCSECGCIWLSIPFHGRKEYFLYCKVVQRLLNRGMQPLPLTRDILRRPYLVYTGKYARFERVVSTTILRLAQMSDSDICNTLWSLFSRVRHTSAWGRRHSGACDRKCSVHRDAVSFCNTGCSGCARIQDRRHYRLSFLTNEGFCLGTAAANDCTAVRCGTRPEHFCTAVWRSSGQAVDILWAIVASSKVVRIPEILWIHTKGGIWGTNCSWQTSCSYARWLRGQIQHLDRDGLHLILFRPAEQIGLAILPEDPNPVEVQPGIICEYGRVSRELGSKRKETQGLARYGRQRLLPRTWWQDPIDRPIYVNGCYARCIGLVPHRTFGPSFWRLGRLHGPLFSGVRRESEMRRLRDRIQRDRERERSSLPSSAEAQHSENDSNQIG
ncbi:hypothetical protein [Hubei myriapoda virus 9]|uniref:hypothetical protein n=1 Tax=Hubei myriapoda virus 9 TaxID=1922938 RepID=UPI00090B0A11|nr:hypothetical protein [Hubei myriapoda virus 9]APG75637.1 hypothetical protein [Hubei myriapoda virus 9]APG75893.1 hypothetical protein 1 [Hubei myriapoda virus 9]APG75929.1 hypothetical protein 1 [Hubei myriapoda virus 9]APG75937.1 hypothetical protein 1 [Hubei myriapoda virus 9]APG75966.1 hypothetical protein 1 [Hubei myriapoda virus 9]